MSNKFDELAKSLAGPSTRRQLLKKFGVGLAATALACFGLADKAKAADAPDVDPRALIDEERARPPQRSCKAGNEICHSDRQCCSGVCARWNQTDWKTCMGSAP